MTMRRMLLGLVGAAAVSVCGAATAKPPLSEGREVDPVVRDFQLGGSPAAVEGSAPTGAPEKPGDVFGWALLVALHDALMAHFTMPLGTVPGADAR